MRPNRHDQPQPVDEEAPGAFPADHLPPEFDADPDDGADFFAPPVQPCECYCLHCGRLFASDQIWFQRAINARDGFAGFWMCPTPNCDGRGFTFDIFPTDPHHPANADVLDDEEDDEAWLGEAPGEDWTADAEEAAEYDPAEPEYADLDDCCDDIEGEEWKYGLAPGEALPEPGWQRQSREEWEARQRRFDEPDERPREIDMSQFDRPGEGDVGEDEIPF